jgi:hypothetical protein
VIIQNVTVLNPAESKVSLIDMLSDFDFDPVESTDATKPTAVYDPYVESVENLDITIRQTKDGSVPSRVQLAIFGCAKPQPLVTKSVVEPTTTGKPTQGSSTSAGIISSR